MIGDEATTPGVVLSGLEPGTTYHYHFVAQSSGGGPVFGVDHTFTTFPVATHPASPCPNAALRTGPSAHLSECRAYEMVSPLDKENGEVNALESLYFGSNAKRFVSRLDQATPDGEGITYSATRAYGAPESAPWSSQYLASRDAKVGWQNRAINPPRSNFPLNGELGQEVTYKAFSEDLCSSWFLQDTDRSLLPGAPGNAMNLYRRRNCGKGGYELLTSVVPPGYSREEAPSSWYLPLIQGQIEDGTHSFVRANGALTPDAAPGKTYQLYETSEAPGGMAELRLISVLPDGSAADRHSTIGTAAGGLGDFRSDNVQRAISEDGSRVFWSVIIADTSKKPVPSYSGGFTPGELYLRANPLAEASSSGECDEAGKACTLQLAGPDSVFWTADREGDTVIFQTGAQLFEAQIEEEGEALLATTTPIAAGVIGVMGASEDATRVYFTSKDALAPGAIAGKPNLYLHERGLEVRLVANLGSLDATQSDFVSLDNVKPGWRRARVSADGAHALFMSTTALTGHDNVDLNSSEPDSEVFLYDAQAGEGAGELVCISCNPSGARPVGRRVDEGATAAALDIWAAAELPGWESQSHASRALSEDGSFAYFESYQALVPADRNGAADVYEWRRASGHGECEALGAALYVPSSGGCLSLISSGESQQDSRFIDASADGRDVFFTTEESLFSEDPGLVDLYDARIGGGFAPRPSGSSCQGEACQGTATAPDGTTPASASFHGPGNQVQPTSARRCPQGKRKVRQAGRTRCVKPPKQKRKQEHGKRKAGR